MLATKVFIDSPASSGGGQYTFNLFFSVLSLAKYLNVGDYVKDTANNEYSIVSLASNPHTDGSQVTVSFVTSDVLPLQDSDYNSDAYTPGQVDVRPSGSTDINIDNAAIYNAQNYEYTLNVTVGSLQEANKIVVGDQIVSISGKDYELTYIDPVNRFNAACRVTEVIKEGVIPALGPGSMYQSTLNLGLFRGTPISDPARTVIRNRDNFLVDSKIKEVELLALAGGTGSSVEVTLINNSGGTLTKLTPVKSNISGEIDVVDPAVETDVVSLIGLVKADILNTQSGTIVVNGLLKDITTSAVFGDDVFLSKTGGVTNVEPSIGVGGFVAGDFIVRLGVITKNQTNPILKDILVNIQLVGQL